MCGMSNATLDLAVKSPRSCPEILWQLFRSLPYVSETCPAEKLEGVGVDLGCWSLPNNVTSDKPQDQLVPLPAAGWPDSPLLSIPSTQRRGTGLRQSLLFQQELVHTPQAWEKWGSDSDPWEFWPRFHRTDSSPRVAQLSSAQRQKMVGLLGKQEPSFLVRGSHT